MANFICSKLNYVRKLGLFCDLIFLLFILNSCQNTAISPSSKNEQMVTDDASSSKGVMVSSKISTSESNSTTQITNYFKNYKYATSTSIHSLFRGKGK
jgi:uncharacterized protein YcfL